MGLGGAVFLPQASKGVRSPETLDPLLTKYKRGLLTHTSKYVEKDHNFIDMKISKLGKNPR